MLLLVPLALLVAVGVALLVGRAAGYTELLDSLRSASPWWLAICFAGEVVAYAGSIPAASIEVPNSSPMTPHPVRGSRWCLRRTRRKGRSTNRGPRSEARRSPLSASKVGAGGAHRPNSSGA